MEYFLSGDLEIPDLSFCDAKQHSDVNIKLSKILTNQKYVTVETLL